METQKMPPRSGQEALRLTAKVASFVSITAGLLAASVAQVTAVVPIAAVVAASALGVYLFNEAKPRR